MPRLALATVVGATTIVASLILQRMIAGAPQPGVVPVSGAPIPLFAGIGLALLHGVGVAVTVGFASRHPQRWVDRIVRIWPLIALLLTIGLLW